MLENRPTKSVFTAEYESFLRRLISARKTAEITQQELANRLGRFQSFVSKYERRERRLDVVEFVRIAKAIGIDPCEIVREIETHVTKQSKPKTGR